MSEANCWSLWEECGGVWGSLWLQRHKKLTFALELWLFGWEHCLLTLRNIFIAVHLLLIGWHWILWVTNCNWLPEVCSLKQVELSLIIRFRWIVIDQIGLKVGSSGYYLSCLLNNQSSLPSTPGEQRQLFLS